MAWPRRRADEVRAGRPGARVAAALVLAALALLAGCDAQRAELPRVAGNNWPGYWPLYLAERRAPQEFARMTELHSATEVMRAFRNGVIDVAALTLDEALQLASEGQQACVFLVLDTSAGGDALVARPEFTTPAALNGHRVGVEATALGAFMLSRVAELTALDPAAITVIELPSGDHVQAYGDGRVDALVTFEPMRSRLLAHGARELFSSRDIPGEIVDVLVTRCNYIENHRAALATLVAHWRAAVSLLQASPDTAWSELAGFAHGERDDFAQALAGIAFPEPAQQAALLGGELDELVARLTPIMRHYRLLAEPARGTLRTSTAAWQAAP